MHREYIKLFYVGFTLLQVRGTRYKMKSLVISVISLRNVEQCCRLNKLHLLTTLFKACLESRTASTLLLGSQVARLRSK